VERYTCSAGRTANTGDNLDTHDVYDPKRDTWAIAAPLPHPRSAGAYVVLNNLIIMQVAKCKPGGKPSTPNAYDEVTAYDPKSNRWSDLRRCRVHGMDSLRRRLVALLLRGGRRPSAARHIERHDRAYRALAQTNVVGSTELAIRCRHCH